MNLDPNVSEWLNLFVRWFHVFAGILWIGTTYFFTWLDGRLSEQEKSLAGGEKAQVWMVHSGGFYVVEKQKSPGTHSLHWFRWEAAFTWLSGILLLVIVYYMSSVLVDPDGPVSHRNAVFIGIGVLVVAWLVYDLVLAPLMKYHMVFAAISYVLIVAVTYGLTRVMSGRAAYIHVGAMFGTIMAANVWMRILPAQRQTIAAAREDKPIDGSLAARAKLRSKHNTFLVVPVVFTMISNHFPAATYGESNNWVILGILILVGWAAAMVIRRA